ncbi:MAG: DUF2721 domain-containing protein [Pseudomonadales bacterium]
MDPSTAIETLAEVIQLAVAPVFLLAGISGILNVLSTRLGRIVDRTRVVEEQLALVQEEENKGLLQLETSSLWRRIRMIHWAIRMCVGSALLISLVIMSLFIGEFVHVSLSLLIAVLFVAAMIVLVVGLILFLLEVNEAAYHMGAGMAIFVGEEQKLKDE